MSNNQAIVRYADAMPFRDGLPYYDPPTVSKSWLPALCRLLAGLSETAIGAGLLLGQAAAVMGRQSSLWHEEQS